MSLRDKQDLEAFRSILSELCEITDCPNYEVLACHIQDIKRGADALDRLEELLKNGWWVDCADYMTRFEGSDIFTVIVLRGEGESRGEGSTLTDAIINVSQEASK